MFRDAVRALIESNAGCEVVGEASDGHEALAALEQVTPDLVVIETTLPRLPGTEVARRSKGNGSHARFLFLSTRNGRKPVEEAFQSGACGYLCKSDSAKDLLTAIEATRRGQTYLSPSVTGHLVDIAVGRGATEGNGSSLTSRELEILQLIAEGMSSKEIAAALHVSVRTVDSHRANLMEKLGIRKVSGLVRYAIREGLLQP